MRLAIPILFIGLSAMGQYVPPVGIPAPPFGINENPTFPNPWTNTISGMYFIDRLHTNATDTANTNGYPSKPRLTIPNGDSKSYEAGALVVVTNGPYGPSSTAFHINFTNGTAANPIFFMGYGQFGASGSNAWITNREFQVWGNYFIIHGFLIQGIDKRGKIRQVTGRRADNWCVRYCEVTDPGASSGNLLTMGLGTNCVFYRNYLHHGGNYQSLSSHDVHGMLAGNGSHNFWVLENDAGFLQGDSVQINAGQSPTDRPTFIYIGRNKFHDNKENAVDLKTCEHVFFVENECYNFPRINLGGSGEPIAINDENRPQDGDHHLWVLLNRIHDCGADAIRHQSWCHSYGNVCWNVFGDPTWNPGAGYGLVSYGTFTDYFENNTFVNADQGGQIFGGNAGTRHELRNNIFANVGTNNFTFSMENVGETNSVLLNSQFPNSVLFKWVGIYNSVASLQFAQPAYCSGNFSSTAGLVNTNGTSAFNGELMAGSAAIESGTTPTIPAAFMALYGLDISVDINHTSRPQGAAWDVGAYEYNVTNKILTVTSTTSPGADISVTPLDSSGLGDGATTFTRGYSSNTLVTITAPSAVLGFAFVKWQVDGIDYTFGPSTNIMMNSAHTAHAVYNGSSTLKNIVITSSPPGTSISVSPLDNNGNSDGVTPFTRVYNAGTFVQLTPHNSALNPFITWLMDGVDLAPPDSVLFFQVDADHTLTEVNTAPRLSVNGRSGLTGKAIVR